MKFGFRIVFHNDIEWSPELREFLTAKLNHFASEGSYKCRRESRAFYRRGRLGLVLDSKFNWTSSSTDLKYTFRRLTKNRRIFGVIPLDKIEGWEDLDLKQCMCAMHRGGHKVKLKSPYNQKNYTTFAEVGEIKG